MCFGSPSAPTTSNSLSLQNSSTSYSPWASSGAQSTVQNAQNALAANPAQSYTGPAQASFGPEWRAAANYLGGQLGRTNPYTTQAGGALQGVLGSLDPNASVSSLMNPYLASVLAPTLQNLDIQYGKASNQNAGNAAMAGAYGGSAQGVGQALLDRSHEQDVANATGQAYSGAYNTALAQKLQQLGIIGNTANSLGQIGQNAFGQGTTLASTLAGMGSTEQQAGQTGINTALNINKQNATLPLTQQSLLAQILSTLAPLGGTTTNSFGFGQQQQQNPPNNSGFSLLGTALSSLLAA